MGIHKDKIYKYWVYSFQYLGKNYGGRGFKTRRDANTAREARRLEVKQQKIQTVIGFRIMANEYLDIAERKFVHDVYLRKAHVYREFLKVNDDLPVDQITTSLVYLGGTKAEIAESPVDKTQLTLFADEVRRSVAAMRLKVVDGDLEKNEPLAEACFSRTTDRWRCKRCNYQKVCWPEGIMETTT